MDDGSRSTRITFSAANRPSSPPPLYLSGLFLPKQINRDKRFVVTEAGITLNKLHVALGALGLAMSNLGSISDQTLAGVITTATHGSGVNYGVISAHVLALGLLLADGTLVRCSKTENPDLFMASLCGLGSTGLLIFVTLEVEPAFRLKEVSETVGLDETIENLDELAGSGEHVRMWWFPQTDRVRVSVADRTREVRWTRFSSSSQLILNEWRNFPRRLPLYSRSSRLETGFGIILLATMSSNFSSLSRSGCPISSF